PLRRRGRLAPPGVSEPRASAARSRLASFCLLRPGVEGGDGLAEVRAEVGGRVARIAVGGDAVDDVPFDHPAAAGAAGAVVAADRQVERARFEQRAEVVSLEAHFAADL